MMTVANRGKLGADSAIAGRVAARFLSRGNLAAPILHEGGPAMKDAYPFRSRSLIVALAAVCSFGGGQGLALESSIQPGDAVGVNTTIRADLPLEISFPPRLAKYVRIFIERSFGGQPCIDELEVYAEAPQNVASAALGAAASASSCLPGYAIHQIAHLNDGLYGNSHSWIAATDREEWAQIELPRALAVSKVVISRDRDGVYHDRLPVEFRVETSWNGDDWVTAARVHARPNVPPPRDWQYSGRHPLPDEWTWPKLLEYAFLCERDSWLRMSADDHLSPLRTDRPAVPGGPGYWARIARLDPLDRTLTQFAEMIARLEARGLDVAMEREELQRLQDRRDAWKAASHREDLAYDQLYYDARLAKRRLMFRDPDLAGLETILFVKRYPYWSSHNYSDVLDSQFRPGGGVFVLRSPLVDGRYEPEAAEQEMLFDASEGIARDAVADFSARRIFFAYRPDRSPREGWLPNWHLMSVDADGSNLRRLTDGPYHDYYPCPLPDGGLAFISTRVEARFLCWRPQAFVLYRMDADGGNIRPLSHANLSEWTPTVMRDGRILWTRSEYVDKGADFGHTLWTIRPDGTHPELIFGNNTPNCYINGHEVPDSPEIVCTLFSHGGDHNGPIGLIQRSRSPFDTTAVTNITPDVTPHYNMNWPRYECFRDPAPISRDYFLVAHAPGERFGLYVIDRYGNRELIYLDREIDAMSPTPLRPRPRPPVLPPSTDPDLAARGRAVLSLADVYQGLSPHVRPGEVRYLRVCEEVRSELERLPDGQCRWDHEEFQDWYASPTHLVRGPNGWPSYVAKATWGLVPVNEDGSATFEVPAGKVLYFQVLDGEYNELQRMRSVLQLQPGERRSCVGCHENRRAAPVPETKPGAGPAVAAAEPPPWGAGPFSYEKFVQPVWDRHCVRCHDAADARGFNLSGDLDPDKVPASYRTLITGGWVHYFDYTWNLRHHKAEPRTFGTLRSKLWAVLEAGHHEVSLSGAEKRAVKCWIDLNCPLWPDYRYRLDRPAASQGLVAH